MDTGTKLLLKSVAQRIVPDPNTALLDVGCGIGVVGLAIVAKYPSLKLLGIDRDALAVRVSEENAGINGLPGGFSGSLDTGHVEAESQDLIVSNLPAKAGREVLRHLLQNMTRCLTRTGVAAVVIVKPLEGNLAEDIEAAGAVPVYEENGPGHTVFHFVRVGASSMDRDPESLKPYIRNVQEFQLERESYRLAAVYGISDFDQIGDVTALSAALIRRQQFKGRVLFWHPGQGHLPMFVNRRWGKRIREWILAGRDLLELRITRKNLLDAGVEERTIRTLHVPFLWEVEGPVDGFFCFPDRDPDVPWYDEFFFRVRKVLRPGGFLLVTSRSTLVHRLMSRCRLFRPIEDRKYHGYRGVLLKKI